MDEMTPIPQARRRPSNEGAALDTEVDAALEALPPEPQRIIDLSIVHGLSHSEIATRVGMPLGTVKTQVRRGLIKVRQALGIGRGGPGEGA